jgi:hypothetical protein
MRPPIIELLSKTGLPPVIDVYPVELQPLVDAFNNRKPISEEDYIAVVRFIALGNFAAVASLTRRYPQEILYGGLSLEDRERLGAIAVQHKR